MKRLVLTTTLLFLAAASSPANMLLEGHTDNNDNGFEWIYTTAIP